MSNLDPHLSALRDAVLSLKSTGSDGFEGLLAAVLSALAGQPFRLASSGSQRGRDGDSALDAGATYFEAKLYSGSVPKAVVSNKLLEISNDDQGQIDTWILAATSEISSQHAEFYRESLTNAGIGFLILDWSENALPILAVALAKARHAAEQFLDDHLSDKSKITAALSALDAIATNQLFSDLSNALVQSIREPALGLGIAKARNRAWLVEAFSNKKRARQFFGQPLAPLDRSGLAGVARPQLNTKLSPAFSGAPDAAVFFVLGDEGTGKSWLVAQSWAVSSTQPLMAVFTADELKDPIALLDIEGLIIAKLIAQTGDVPTEATKKRWHRRFKGWRANPNPQNVRIVIWVDGLNQAPNFPWARWIDAAAVILEELGGHVVITSRTSHFAERLRNGVVSKVRRITVEDWSDAELKALLATKTINADRLSAEVFNFLRNPRILSIAVELLDHNDIEGFEELSVGRLLFEHILRCERDGTAALSAQDFAKGLQSHASIIIKRIAQSKNDDLRVFDVALDFRFKAVSQSRFFEAVAGDSDLYEIREDGLALALGLWLVSALRKEVRNNRDPAERLGTILEPVLALDRTAEAVYSALLVATLEGDCPITATAALIQTYVLLQNLPENGRAPFESLAKRAPAAFLQAVRAIALAPTHYPNFDWLTSALIKSRSDPSVWESITLQVADWLRIYSLSADRSNMARMAREPKEKVEAERAKEQQRIDKNLASLTEPERQFIASRLKRLDEGELTDLHLVGFMLIAGMPLSRFAYSFVEWAFSDALNSTINARHREFEYLISLNSTDWSATRAAILAAIEPLKVETCSDVGKWTLVYVLRATGDADDAARAASIYEELTKDREKFGAWKLVENYCATDPCDPNSAKPNNIADTARKYGELDVAKLHVGIGNTTEGHFFTMARPGLARFEPSVSIDTHRRFARDVANREGLALRQGIIALQPHSALLDHSSVEEMITIAKNAPATLDTELTKERDTWITAQYSLSAALPHKSGNEQLDIIAAVPGTSLLLALLEASKPADEDRVEGWLERVLQTADEKAQARVLGFAYYSRSPLTARAKSIVEVLFESQDRFVRMQALAIIARDSEPTLLARVLASSWDANSLDPDKDYFEIWYGSLALVSAAQSGLMGPDEALDRISPSFYGIAAERFAGTAIGMCGARLDAALAKSLAFANFPMLPKLEQSTTSDLTPPLLSLSDRAEPLSAMEFFKRASESEEDFQARQKRAWQAYERFSKDLTAANARFILESVAPEGIKAIAREKPPLVADWTRQLLVGSDSQLRSLHTFALAVAKAISAADPQSSVKLFARLSKVDPLINYVVGPAKMPVERLTIWSAAHIAEVKSICFDRLDTAPSDADLATEVLAALQAGKSAEVETYIEIKLAESMPASNARAVMVSGFSDEGEHARNVLAKFANAKGLIGRAYEAAKYAYERNVWAKYWYRKMRAADSNEEFWRYSVLFTKTVDERYSMWVHKFPESKAPFNSFAHTLKSAIEKSIQDRQSKRRGKLFGENAPPEFLRPRSKF